MKYEISAGGLLIRQKGDIWQILLIKDMNGSWTFPKGLIEKGEKPQVAASREIAEEVGLQDLKLLKALTPIEYWYRRNGLIHKTVHYFVFQIRGNPKLRVQKEEGITRAHWFSFAKALAIVGYPQTNKKLLLAAKEAIKKILEVYTEIDPRPRS